MEQTNRTILFEEVNPEKLNLLSFMLDDRTESLNDDELNEIHRHLEVSSYEEALEKLTPTIYLAFSSDEGKVLCTNKQKECLMNNFQEVMSIHLDASNPMTKTFTSMLKQQKGRVNIEHSPEDILHKMFVLPKKNTFYKSRNQLIRYIINGQEKKACEQLDKIIKEYDQCIFLLQVYIDSVQNALATHETTDENIIVIDEREEQQVAVWRCSEHFYVGRQMLTMEQEQLVNQFLGRHLEKRNIKNRILMADLLYIYDINKMEQHMVNHYEIFLEYYRQIINEYWSKSRELLETLLGIFVFFEQYQTQEKIMPPKMVIANIKPEMIIDIKYREKLDCYLKSVNQKLYYEDTLWYAVLPRLQWNDYEEKTVRERFQGNNRNRSRESNSVQSIQVLANMLADYQIQVFISPNVVEKATNRYVTRHGIEEWVDLQRDIADRQHADYIYPCIPNFTLMPSEHTEYCLGRKITYSEWGEVCVKEQYVKIWLETIGIEAAYVAAGLMAACQCPGYLKERFRRNTDMELPGVSYHIMDDEHSKKTYSTMRMDVFRYQKEIVESLEQKSVGFVFLPYPKGARILCDYAASYLYGKKNRFSDVQTVTYLEREIRVDTQDFKSTLIKRFFQKRPGSIWEKWSQNDDMVNAILKKEENLEYRIDEQNNSCTFEITLHDTKREQVVKLNT